MAEIKYNNVNPFGDRPPLLSRETTYIYSSGAKVGRVDNITLSGRLKRTVCESGFESLYNLTKTLILAFSQNFKKLEVIDNGGVLYSYNTTIVESINFDEDKYFDLVPYTISLKCYKDKHVDSFSVLEPTDEYSYNEEGGCLVSITHNVSCRGINNSTEALTNARNFISGRSGFNPDVSPVGYSVASPVLIDKKESVNRLTAEVSISETYRYDKSGLSGDAALIQTTTTEQSIENGSFVLTVNGSLQGAVTSNIAVTRAGMAAMRTSSDNFANYEYSLYNPSGTLFLIPNQSSISENGNENKIEYSFTYSDAIRSDPYVIDQTVISRSDGRDCISTSLTIKSNFGCPATRYSKTKAYYDALDLLGYVNTRWALYGYSTRLGRIPRSKSTSVDPLSGDISVSVSYCSDNYEDCGCLESLNYTMSFTDPIPQFSEEASLEGEGCYSIQNLKYNSRATFSISGTCRPSKCCSIAAAISQARTRANQLMAEFFNATDIILDKSSVDFSEKLGIISFSFSWNGKKAVPLNNYLIFGT